MKKIRKTVNSNDILSYADEDYLIFRKEGAIVGNLMMPLDLLHMGVTGLESEENVILFYKKDYTKIILALISRLKKTIENYPEDI